LKVAGFRLNVTRSFQLATCNSEGHSETRINVFTARLPCAMD